MKWQYLNLSRKEANTCAKHRQ